MGKPMRIRARAEGDVVEVKILISHVMETGFRKDQEGGLIPAHFIQFVTVTTRGAPCCLHNGVRRFRPTRILSFKFRGGRKGETLTVAWTDNAGDSRSDEAVIG